MTSSYLRFTPVYGAKSSEPYCYLLQIGSVTVLLDCGWNDSFDLALLEPLIRVLPAVDLVLLSHPDLYHLGALPYLMCKAGLKAPVYAAAPAAKLGLMFMYDHYTALHAVSDFQLFDSEDIDAAFDSINSLKHHQYLTITLKCQQLRLVGYPAGHMVGGTVWVIEAGGEVIVYGVNTNHKKERLLNVGELDKVPSRPALVITDGARSNAPEIKKRDRDKKFEAALLSVLRGSIADAQQGPDSKGGTVRGEQGLWDSRDRAGKKDPKAAGGSVLLPVDTAGRMLEVLLVLDKIWQSQHATRLPYPIVLLSCCATSTMTAARGLLEFMSSELQGEFHTTYNSPLNIRNLQCAHNINDVMAMGSGPKVVLATCQGMDYGMARELLLRWGSQPQNAVIFTQQPRPGTFAADLLAHGPKPRQLGAVRTFHLTIGKRVPLEAEELEAYEAAKAAAEAEKSDTGVDDDGLAALPLRESSAVNTQLKRSTTGAVEQVLVTNTLDMFEDTNMVDEDVLMDGFVPPKTAMYCMFPDEQEAVLMKWDEWGAVIDTADIRTVEEADLGTAAADDDELEPDNTPTKVVTEQVTLSVQAPVWFIDGFSGCSDGRSLRTVLAGLAPRALVIVGASQQCTADMADSCRAGLPQQQTKIYTPGPREELSFPMAANYPLAVNPLLLHGLSKHKLDVTDTKYEVAWIDGQIGRLHGPTAAVDAENGGGLAAATATGADTAGSNAQGAQHQQQAAELQPEFLLQPPGTVATEQSATESSVIAAAAEGDEPMEVEDHSAGPAAEGPAASATADPAAEDLGVIPAVTGDHGGIFIGSVQLSQVKVALTKAGFVTEFGKGRLVIAGSLVVSSDGPKGQLVLEGPLCDDYFRVRDVVYSQYNVC